jgi:uncharacterized protein
MVNPRPIARAHLRRLAISRQHLDDRAPAGDLDIVRDLGCLQLDPIRAVERPPEMILFSRTGSDHRDTLETLLWDERSLFTYWAHVASLVLTEDYPVHQWRMRGIDRLGWGQKIVAWLANPPARALHDEILATARERGAITASDFHAPEESPFYTSGWTTTNVVNRLIDYLWHKGDLAIVGRRGNARIWGPAEDFLPDWTPRAEWDDLTVTRYAAQRAIRALGAATPRQIRLHYTRDRYPALAEALAALVAEGTLLPVQVMEDGAALKGPWYMHVEDLPLLERIEAGDWAGRTTWLSPFDNLIADRDRTELLWDFRYRIEIYVPASKREYGYYVLPLLHGDRLIGRMDAKMDRASAILNAGALYAEADAPDDAATLEAIRGATASLAGFLGAEQITWGEVPARWQALRN